MTEIKGIIAAMQTAMNELSNHDHSRFITIDFIKIRRKYNIIVKIYYFAPCIWNYNRITKFQRRIKRNEKTNQSSN